MKKTVMVFLSALLLVSVAIFASCGLKVGGDGTITTIQKQLETPNGLRIDAGNLCWNPVEFAAKYTVSIDGAEYICSDYKYPLDGIKDGEHVFKVKANGDGVQYTSSSFSSELRVELEGSAPVSRGYYGQFDELTKNESFLGYGFDVINSAVFSDKYLKTSFPLFDNEKLMQQRLVKIDSKYSTVEEIFESDMEKFLQQWNVNANVNVSWGKKKIGGSVRVEAAYSGGSATAKSKSFHSISITNQKFYIVLQSSIDTYKSMLNESVVNDLYSDMEPAALFDRYGTHFITSAVMGGRINSYYLYTSDEEKKFNDVSSKVSTEVRYLVGKTDVNVEGGYKDYADENHIYIKNTLDVLGGSDFGMRSDSDIGVNYLAWEKSLNDHASLIGIKDTGSLIPVWELIDSSKDTRIYEWDYDGDGVYEQGNRAQQLQAYFNAYGLESYNSLMEAAALPTIVTPDSITNIKVNNLTAKNGLYDVYAGSLNDLSFTVLPAEALGYTKAASISGNCPYSRINNENGGLALEVDVNAPAGEYIDIVLSAGAVRETIKVRVLRRYTVTYHSNGGTEIKPLQNVLHGTQIDEPEKPQKKGYIFVGWYTDPDFAEDSLYQFGVESVKNNLNLYAKWLPYYPKITFVSNISSIKIDGTSVRYNTVFERPVDPVAQGYTFGGYYTDKELKTEFDFTQKILTDTVIYVKWYKDPQISYYDTITNKVISEKIIKYNTQETKFEQATKEGYTFGGYYADKELKTEFDFTQKILTDTVIYIKWVINKYDVHFETNGGVAVEKITAGYGSKIEKPVTTKAGYEFAGWYKDPDFGQLFDFNVDKVTGSFTLYAKWANGLITVRFYTQNLGVLDDRKIEYDTVLGVNIPTLEVFGYTFNGWFKEESYENEVTEHTIFNNNSFANLTDTKVVMLYAKIQPNKSLITLDKDGGIGGTDYYYEVYKTANYFDIDCKSLASSVLIPEKTGYAFKGYYAVIADEEKKVIDENGQFLPTAVFGEETTLTAKWQAKEYTLSVDLQSDLIKTVPQIEDETFVITYGEVAFLPVPSAEYYSFIGWSTDYDNTPITDSYGKLNLAWNFSEELTLYANWRKVDEYADYDYISTAKELAGISVSGKSLLVCNLDLGGASWTPISTFSGVFDGGGHTISNLKTSSRSGFIDNGAAYAGCFAYINTGEIKSVIFDGVTISVSATQQTNDYRSLSVGGVVGINKNTISAVGVVNSNIYGYLGHEKDKNGAPNHIVFVGGIAAYNSKNINHCYVKNSVISGYINAQKNYCRSIAIVGGICGEVSKDGTISYLISTNNTISAKSRGGYWGGLGKRDGTLECYAGYVFGISYCDISNIISCSHKSGSLTTKTDALSGNMDATKNAQGMLVAKTDKAVKNCYIEAGDCWLVGNHNNYLTAMTYEEIVNASSDWTKVENGEILFK
ncbi:MAG: InlB B-repeat-containing protein [Candidatus Borkfalkiaceae bacterium]|nr:InlB B-repeat-containing protein [Christensenellaceae bacterium]